MSFFKHDTSLGVREIVEGDPYERCQTIPAGTREGTSSPFAEPHASRGPVGTYRGPVGTCLAVLQGRLHYARTLGRLKRDSVCSTPTIHLDAVHNVLPNSGPLLLAKDFSSAAEIVATFRGLQRRAQGSKDFEGFAPDDAVFDEARELGRLWSNAQLAGFIAAFGYTNYNNLSVLELGCGAAHLFFFLRGYRLSDYMGIDGNPYFVISNRFLRGHEQHFQILNLQEEIMLYEGANPLKFDIVCSFEVLEHIREDAVDSFIQTIRNHMHSRSAAFLTASLETWYDVHVLVRDCPWWLRRFANLGLYPRSDEAELIRMLGESHPFNWGPDNSNMFALEVRD